MKINTALLEKYFIKNGAQINTNIDIDSPMDIGLCFVLGDSKDGNRVEYLDFDDLINILEVNNITGENGLLVLERDNESKGYGERDKKMESLIYDTLSKYIIIMFWASTQEVVHPEIIPLEKHKKHYFRNNISI